MTTNTYSRRRERGLTLIEVIVSLVILATGMIALLAALGSATESTMNTIDRRKMRYLAQIVMADVEVGKLSPDEEEERYEEGTTDSFEGWGSADDPNEYARFEYRVEALRDELITPGGTDPEKLIEAGFEETGSGTWSRPVSNDGFFGNNNNGGGLSGENGPEGDEPEGPMKRLAIISIRKVSENPDDEMVLKIMTYLPSPDEETQDPAAAGGAAPGAGAAPGGAGGNAAGGFAPGGAGRGGNTRGGTDR